MCQILSVLPIYLFILSFNPLSPALFPLRGFLRWHYYYSQFSWEANQFVYGQQLDWGADGGWIYAVLRRAQGSDAAKALSWVIIIWSQG